MSDIPATTVSLGQLVQDLNDRANAGDRSAMAELEVLLDEHPEIWRLHAEHAADVAGGWAKVLSNEAAGQACLRREARAWASELAGVDSGPLVKATAGAAAVAMLAARHAERELAAADRMRRAGAAKKAASANHRLREALKLVATARATEAARSATPATGAQPPVLRLFAGGA